MSDDKETPIYNPNSPEGDDGCKDCCSFFLGAFSLTGLVAVLVPMLIHEMKRVAVFPSGTEYYECKNCEHGREYTPVPDLPLDKDA